METWLLEEWANSPYKNKTSLIQAIVNGDQAAYVRAQAEALAYLEWLKKFSVAFLDEPEPKKVTTDGAGQ